MGSTPTSRPRRSPRPGEPSGETQRAGNGSALASDTSRAHRYGSACTVSTRTQALRSGLVTVVPAATAEAAASSATSISVSSRAADNACRSGARCACFGVRRNGMPRVNRPRSIATPMVWESARPAAPAARVSRGVAPTHSRYRCNSFATRNANSDKGSSANIASGASMRVGAASIAIDQPSAARLKARLKPSASHGSQPAMK